ERTYIIDSYYGADEDVYIVYGNDNFYFDDVKTYHDGTFRFSNLVKGTYIVYALSDPSARALIPVADTIHITEDYQHIELENDLIIIK
ncbi:MAG: hypothetical protein HC906_10735, partial [Bacteroidales bacterium]|nr:hypothetical protein [Bacteroidales bacterium]